MGRQSTRQFTKRLVLNLPPELHTTITELAKKELRPLNMEAVLLLSEALAARQAGR